MLWTVPAQRHRSAIDWLRQPGIAGKWLAMLKEIALRLTRAALVVNPKTTAYDYFLRNAKAAAALLDIEVVSSPINGIADFEPAIESFARVAITSLRRLSGADSAGRRLE